MHCITLVFQYYILSANTEWKIVVMINAMNKEALISFQQQLDINFQIDSFALTG